MSKLRRHLTYANVISTLFVFVLLAGGTAVAAKSLGKKTVGPKQLKSNAVTTPKIKKGAVTKVKIADGAIDSTKLADNAVTTSKIPDGAVTGAKIAAGSTVFGRRVVRFQKSELVPMMGGSFPYPIGSYTQPAGEANQYLGSVEFEFAASCTQPRSATAILMIDAPNPAAPLGFEFAGLAAAEDKGAGTVRRTTEFSSFPSPASTAMSRTGPVADTPRKFDLLLTGASCSAGSGVSVSGVTIDVIGTR